ncbi:MAG: hypothetical protein ACI8ZN_001426 [Bacteroidia bacterium]|jgi:hypothetical protein
MKWIVSCLIILSCGSTAFSQKWAIETNVSLNYSGLSQSVRPQFIYKDVSISLGPKVQYNRSAGFNKSAIGLSFDTDYQLDGASGFFVQYDFISSKINNITTNIQEAYAGLMIQKEVKTVWLTKVRMGIGGYVESTSKYTLKGYHYCTNLSVSYQF